MFQSLSATLSGFRHQRQTQGHVLIHRKLIAKAAVNLFSRTGAPNSSLQLTSAIGRDLYAQ